MVQFILAHSVDDRECKYTWHRMHGWCAVFSV